VANSWQSIRSRSVRSGPQAIALPASQSSSSARDNVRGTYPRRPRDDARLSSSVRAALDICRPSDHTESATGSENNSPGRIRISKPGSGILFRGDFAATNSTPSEILPPSAAERSTITAPGSNLAKIRHGFARTIVSGALARSAV